MTELNAEEPVKLSVRMATIVTVCVAIFYLGVEVTTIKATLAAQEKELNKQAEADTASQNERNALNVNVKLMDAQIKTMQSQIDMLRNEALRRLEKKE